MITFTKRFRAFMNPPEDNWESLEEVRQKTSEALSLPYNLPEFKEKAGVTGEFSTDPLTGIFKPFGRAMVEEVSLPTDQILQRFSWKDVAVPLLLTLLVIGGVFAWQAYERDSLQGIISPIPGGQNATTGENKQAGEVVPPGTELEPGGPYTGTGSTQPPTNLNGSDTANPSHQPCPEGLVCWGTALDGSACTVDAACKIIHPTDPASIDPALKIIGVGDCTLVNPCILIHT